MQTCVHLINRLIGPCVMIHMDASKSICHNIIPHLSHLPACPAALSHPRSSRPTSLLTTQCWSRMVRPSPSPTRSTGTQPMCPSTGALSDTWTTPSLSTRWGGMGSAQVARQHGVHSEGASNKTMRLLSPDSLLLYLQLLHCFCISAASLPDPDLHVL